MARYELELRKSDAKDYRPLPEKDIARILNRIEALRQAPSPDGCEKLSEQERYRIRQGAYRVIYEIIDRALVITIVKTAHRKHVYKRC